MRFKNETLVRRAMNIASEIYFTDKKLQENGYVNNLNWVQKCNSQLSKEEFKILINKENKLYSKLDDYRDELLYRVCRKDIDREEYKLALDKIKSLEDGTYREKYS